MKKGIEIFIRPNTVSNLIEALGCIDDDNSEVGLVDNRERDEYAGRIVLTKWTDQKTRVASYELELADDEDD